MYIFVQNSLFINIKLPTFVSEIQLFHISIRKMAPVISFFDSEIQLSFFLVY